MENNTREFLKYCVKKGYISKEKVKEVVDLAKEQKTHSVINLVGEMLGWDSKKVKHLCDKLKKQSVTDMGEAKGSADSKTKPSLNQGMKIGKYIIQEKLGEGGMGVVYKVFYPKLEKTFAIKMIVAEKENTENIKRLEREAKLASLLQHPNIIKVYDMEEENDLHYIVMDYIEGETLSQTKMTDSFPLRQRLQIIHTLAKALQYAHEKGVIHRDIKPSNIILTDDNTPYLMDFGLACVVKGKGSLTQSGQIMGTPKYMSPEQATGDTRYIDEKSDIYSLGAVLYEVISGKSVVPEGHMIAMLYDAVHKNPIPLSKHMPGISRDVEAICMKCLEKDPYYRYQSAAELADDIDRYLQGNAVKAIPSTLLGQIHKWIIKHKFLATTIVVTLTLALGVFVWLQVHLLNKASELQKKISQAEENGKQALKKGDFRKAVSYLEQSKNLNPDQTPSLEYGIALYYLGYELEAMKILKNIPQSGLGQFYIGACHLRKDEPGEAIEALNHAIDLIQDKRDKARAYYYRGLAYYNVGEYGSKEYINARNDCSKALEIDQDYALAYISRAFFCLNDKQYLEAQNYAGQVSLMKTFDTRSFYLIQAYINIHHKDLSAALQNIEESLVVWPLHMKDVSFSDRTMEWIFGGALYPEVKISLVTDESETMKEESIKQGQKEIDTTNLMNHMISILPEIAMLKKTGRSTKEKFEELSKKFEGEYVPVFKEQIKVLEKQLMKNAMMIVLEYIQGNYIQIFSDLNMINERFFSKSEQLSRNQKDAMKTLKNNPLAGSEYEEVFNLLMGTMIEAQKNAYKKSFDEFCEANRPLMPRLYLLSCVVCCEMKRYSDALKAIEKAFSFGDKVQNNSHLGLLNLIYGWVLYKNGKNENAREFFDKIISGDNSLLLKGHAYIGLGVLKIKEGKNEEALQLFQKAQESASPKPRPDYYLFMAKALRNLNRELEAQDCETSAMKLISRENQH